MPKLTFAQALTRLAELAATEKLTRFEMGDIAADQVPVGDGNARNGSEAKLVQMADAAGLTLDQMKERRLVAHHTPLSARADSVSWSVYREIVNYTANNPAERQRLFALVAQPHPDTKSGRWTVTKLRVEMGRSPIQHTGSEPLVQRIETAPLDDQVTAFERLSAKPEVRQEAARRETVARETYERETAPIRAEAAERDRQAAAWAENDPVVQSISAAQALDELEKVTRVFVQSVAAVFPRIKGVPDPRTDPFAQHLILRQLVARAQGAVDQIRALLETGRPGGDIDDFVQSVLAAAKSEEGGD